MLDRILFNSSWKKKDTINISSFMFFLYRNKMILSLHDQINHQKYVIICNYENKNKMANYRKRFLEFSITRVV